MRFRSIPALLLVVFAGILAGACTSWRTQTGPTPDVIAAQNGQGTIRITRRDQSVIIMRSPQVVGDSIIGSAGDPPQRASVLLADVQRIDKRNINAAKTGGLAVGTALVASLVLLGVAVVVILTGWE